MWARGYCQTRTRQETIFFPGNVCCSLTIEIMRCGQSVHVWIVFDEVNYRQRRVKWVKKVWCRRWRIVKGWAEVSSGGTAGTVLLIYRGNCPLASWTALFVAGTTWLGPRPTSKSLRTFCTYFISLSSEECIFQWLTWLRNIQVIYKIKYVGSLTCSTAFFFESSNLVKS